VAGDQVGNGTIVPVTFSVGVAIRGLAVAEGTGELTGIACTSTTSCVASGSYDSPYEGLVVPVSAAGVLRSLTLVPNSLELEGIDCAFGASCVAVRYTVNSGLFVPVSASGAPGTSETTSTTGCLLGVTCSSITTSSATCSEFGSTASEGVVVAWTQSPPLTITITSTSHWSPTAVAVTGVYSGGNIFNAANGTGSPTFSSGYYLVASDGGIFAYGDAKFNGSTGARTLNKPIVGMGFA
jgi:hypothetical protein